MAGMVHILYVKYRMRWLEEAGGSYVRDRKGSAESDDNKVRDGNHSCVKSYRSGNSWINI